MTGLLFIATEAITSGHVALLIVVVLIAVVTPFLIRRGRRRPPVQEVTPRATGEVVAVRQAADQAMVELLEMGREIQAQIDTKTRVLNKLIRDAEQQADRLTDLLEEPAEEAPPAKTVGEPKKTGSGRWVSNLHGRIEVLHGEGRSAADIARITRLSVQEVNLVLHLIAEAK